jgi:predicted DNA-binding transcriptional regulator AlpA
MQPLKVDRTKLKTVENYAKAYGISKPTIYKRIGDGLLKKVVIDGVTFVLIE